MLYSPMNDNDPVNDLGYVEDDCAIKTDVQSLLLSYAGMVSYKRIRLELHLACGLRHRDQKYLFNELGDLGYTKYRSWSWDQEGKRFLPDIKISGRISVRLF